MNSFVLRLETRTYLPFSGLLVLLCLAGCTPVAGQRASLLTNDEPGPFVGVVACEPGDRSCTSCVNDVRSSFDALSTSVDRGASNGGLNEYGDFTYAKTLPPYGWNTAGLDGADHIQTVHAVRAFELATGDHWLVIDSQDQRYARGNETTFHRGMIFGRRDRETGRIVGRYLYPMPDSPHPGGIQIYGRYLAVGAECPDDHQKCPAFVDFYDVGEYEKYENETCDPSDVVRCDQATGVCTGKPCGPVRFVQRLFLDGSRGEPKQGPKTGRVSAVALTRLADGRYFLYVSRGSTWADGWYYLSDTTTIEGTTKFAYVGEHTSADHVEAGGFSHWADKQYQNVNFVTDCETGRLHLVGLGDALDLYSLSIGRTAGIPDDASWTPTLSRVRSVSDGRCARTREGAGLLSMPDETLALHCITGVADRRAFWQLFRPAAP